MTKIRRIFKEAFTDFFRNGLLSTTTTLIMTLALLCVGIFIIMFLVHKEFINTLLVLLLITLTTLILFELIKPFIRKKSGSE